MQRGRYKHQAYTLCHMFRGWELVNDLPTLTRLGSGSLALDCRAGTCTRDGEPVDDLGMAEILHTWLSRDLSSQGSSINTVDAAELRVQMTIGTASRPNDRSRIWARPDTVWYSCHLDLQSRVIAEGKEYTSQLDDLWEWPRWAAT